MLTVLKLQVVGMRLLEVVAVNVSRPNNKQNRSKLQMGEMFLINSNQHHNSCSHTNATGNSRSGCTQSPDRRWVSGVTKNDSQEVARTHAQLSQEAAPRSRK